VELCNLQDVLCNLARVKTRIIVRLRSGICKLHMHSFVTVEHNLLILQLHELCAT